MIGKFNIIITAPPHRERPVAEIYYNGTQWAEVSKEREEIIVQIYSYPDKDIWEFPYNETIAALEKAKKALMCE